MEKVALVTGGGTGIGRAIAVRLASEGYRVAVNGRTETTIQETVQIIDRAGGCAKAFVADVSDVSQVEHMVAETLVQWGRIDVLVNNAGVAPIRNFEEISAQSFEDTIRINLFSMFYCAKAVVEHMKKQGGGKIINAGSQSSFRQSPQTVEYATSKWAVRGLTRTLAAALGKYNITVNAYCPGTVLTPMQMQISAKRCEMTGMTVQGYYEKRFSEIPLGRPQTEEEVAGLVSYLASSAADNITGQCIMINGGQVMC